MSTRFASPAALAQALQQRAEGAQVQLSTWIREPIRRLMSELKDRYKLGHQLDRLTDHALCSATTYVLTRPLDEFDGMSLHAFRATLLLLIGRQMVQPFGRSVANGVSAVDPLPHCERYECETLYMPYEKVGSFWFGGDWFGGHRTADGSLWVLVADITGHGYAAYLLANALPAIWRTCWSNGQPEETQPAEVLWQMHDLLCDCLPEGVFVECTLLRLRPHGEITVLPAGGTRVLLRHRQGNEVRDERLRGRWLGLTRPTAQDERTYQLDPGDELIVGTDGVFDQIQEFAGHGERFRQVLVDALGSGDLYRAMQSVLQQALADRPQKDDITVVLVRRR